MKKPLPNFPTSDNPENILTYICTSGLPQIVAFHSLLQVIIRPQSSRFDFTHTPSDRTTHAATSNLTKELCLK